MTFMNQCKLNFFTKCLMGISIYNILGCKGKQTVLEKVIGVLITINAKCNIFLLNNIVLPFVRNHFVYLRDMDVFSKESLLSSPVKLPS